MFQNIALAEGVLSPRLSAEIKWGYFSNWRGGAGNNMENDLVQEIMNKKTKSIVQRMGPNKTIDSISKICKAANGIKDIVENFDGKLLLHQESLHHSKPSSMKDEIFMINELLKLKPFEHNEGRYHKSFPNIKRSPRRYLNIVDFHKWLERHKEEFCK